jgi:hypothetical protein
VQRMLQIGYVILCTSAVACSSPDPTATANAAQPSGPLGVPACGDDPAAQPDRCMDAHGAMRCKVNSGYVGDELALCDLPEDEGLVVHFGPKDYADPTEVAKYVLAPGDEQEFCLNVNTPNTTQRLFNSYHGRMRRNSHHLIVTMPSKHQEDDVAPWTCSPSVADRWLFGAQEPQIDVGLGSDAALPKEGAPDYGLAHDLPAQQTLRMDFHNVNGTDQPQLREAWTSILYVDPAEVQVRSDLVGFYNVGISIPPLGHATTKRQRCEAPTDPSGVLQSRYVGLLTGHAHRRLTRFSVWKEKSDGSESLIYETKNWHEPGNAMFRSGIENPALPLVDGGDWGATSGYLTVDPGEALSFECEFQNDLNQTVTTGETSKDEMCNVFGDYFPTTGGMWNCFGG